MQDHRDIGRQLRLFHLQEEAQGSVFWHPRGWAVYQAIESYMREQLRLSGYQEVRGPQVFRRKLWEDSGHWDHYQDAMFNVGEDMILKPMNCPGHVQIFNSGAPSYRQLPMRLAEFGCCHRNEPSGSLQGLMRVRQFVQDDAHIFCREDQVASEVKEFCELLQRVYRKFGFEEIKVSLSLRPSSRAGSDEIWDKAEAALAQAVVDAGLEYEIQYGEGAFYGPKLEFALKDARGRFWQCGTAQLDFVLPERLGAQYVGEDGAKHHPIMIHRAILGSLERFIGILLEHYSGRLPAWLAPVQVVVMSIRPDADEYARRVHRELLEAGVRAELDLRDDNVSQKVRDHSLMLVPVIAAVGSREAQSGLVSARLLGESKPKPMNLNEVIEHLR